MKNLNEIVDLSKYPINKTDLIKVQEDQFIEEFLPKIVCKNSNCEVIDKQGNIRGYITNKELQSSLIKS